MTSLTLLTLSLCLASFFQFNTNDSSANSTLNTASSTTATMRSPTTPATLSLSTETSTALTAVAAAATVGTELLQQHSINSIIEQRRHDFLTRHTASEAANTTLTNSTNSTSDTLTSTLNGMYIIGGRPPTLNFTPHPTSIPKPQLDVSYSTIAMPIFLRHLPQWHVFLTVQELNYSRCIYMFYVSTVAQSTKASFLLHFPKYVFKRRIENPQFFRVLGKTLL